MCDGAGVRACRFGIVGAGWRAEFFVRIAAAMPDRFMVSGVVVRRPDAAREFSARWGVPVYPDLDALLAAGPLDFVISSVTWEANPGVITHLVERGLHVVSETPPAPDAEGLRQLWRDVGGTGQVCVAEQYPVMPAHAARLAAVRSGVIGRPTSVQVSSTHGYHAVALIRGLLAAGFGPATVTAQRFTGPLIDPITRAGWTGDDEPKDAATVLATIDFGHGQHGVYDFTDNQWHNPLRFRRLLVRGSAGEIMDDEVIRFAGPATILRTALVRRQLGYDLNLEGYDSEHITLDGEVLWRNGFLGARWSDEELAIAAVMDGASRWARDGAPPPYSLADACQDQVLALAIDQALTLRQPVLAGRDAWAGDTSD
jgi:predicted dehydrogenase